MTVVVRHARAARWSTSPSCCASPALAHRHVARSIPADDSTSATTRSRRRRSSIDGRPRVDDRRHRRRRHDRGRRGADACRRCLRPLDGVVVADVDELYQEHVTDPDAFPIEDGQLDLAPMVRETVLLELADAPLCRHDCAGLCPSCGIDRNDRAVRLRRRPSATSAGPSSTSSIWTEPHARCELQTARGVTGGSR